MILRPEVRLAPFARRRRPLIYVFSSCVTTDKAYRFDDRAVQELVDGRVGAVDDADDSRREAGFACKFGENQGRAGVALGRFDDDGIAGYDGERDGPQRDHRGEVCQAVFVSEGEIEACVKRRFAFHFSCFVLRASCFVLRASCFVSESDYA